MSRSECNVTEICLYWWMEFADINTIWLEVKGFLCWVKQTTNRVKQSTNRVKQSTNRVKQSTNRVKQLTNHYVYDSSSTFFFETEPNQKQACHNWTLVDYLIYQLFYSSSVYGLYWFILFWQRKKKLRPH